MVAIFFTKLTPKLLDDEMSCVRYIEEIVQLVAPRSAEMRRKNLRHLVTDSEADIIITLAKNNHLPKLSVASQDTVTALVSGGMQEKFDARTKCFYDNCDLAREPFLIKGEQIIAERFTYLERSFRGHPKGTPVFIRETNYAEYCIVIMGNVVLDAQTRDASCKDLIREVKIDLLSVGFKQSTSPKSIFKYLGEGVAGGFLGCFGAMIFNGIFGKDTDNVIAAVYNEIGKIVHEQITDAIIHDLNGQIIGIESWVRNTYSNVQDQWSYEQKNQEILDVEKDLCKDVLGPLREGNFQQAGICVFFTGAGMHLALVQELALQDPKYHEDPMQSGFSNSVRDWATDYSNYAKKVTDDIFSTRMDMITTTNDFASESGTMQWVWRWKDSYTGDGQQWVYVEDSKGNGNGDEHGEEHRDADVKKHRDAVRKDLLEQMGNPYDVIDNWRILIDQPLPKEALPSKYGFNSKL